MSNPFKPHVLNLFADRGNIDEAMGYAQSMILTLPGEHRTAALTALMVVVNTAAKVWPEAEAAPALPLDQLVAHQLGEKIVDLDARLAALAERVAELEVRPVTPEALEKGIEAWADEQFNTLADLWLRDHADLDNEIETWMENNMDVENEVREVLGSANLSITF